VASFNRDAVIAALARDSLDLRPGEWSEFDGMCGTCRGTGQLDAQRQPLDRFHEGSVCGQCDGEGFKR
jgi:hypothetical protein